MAEPGSRPGLTTKIAAALFSLALAVAAAGHAASNVWATDQPLLAARLSPLAAPAKQRLATRTQRVIPGPGGGAQIDVSLATPFARSAFDTDPLSGAALSVLARGQADEAGRNAVLDAASKLTRRDPLLQAALLERFVGDGDFDRALVALDRTLTVYPGYTDRLMPVFTEALRIPAQARRFGEILETNPVWEGNFFRFASSRPELAETLTRLRLAQGDDPAITRQVDLGLMRMLVAQEEYDLARSVYRMASKQGADSEASSWVLDWSKEYPPFDWSLHDEPGQYARPLDDGGLAIYLRRGKGGELARRAFSRPQGVSSIILEHNIGPAVRLDDMEISLMCNESSAVLAEQPFTVSPMHLAINAQPGACEIYRLTISGRAWSTGDEVGGDITRIVVE